ncbi:hypothetical protein SV7mr_17980 [Stieleria bergensis]|uniref:Uncharacterized protein n=1 Tax=Stieleria bergensis TaxID=2528025 RepID=A0A517ST39_9BACT|nr:hypothetical protein SV7mr_17980 [Planctomycetes bacterium SV_7m_r]
MDGENKRKSPIRNRCPKAVSSKDSRNNNMNFDASLEPFQPSGQGVETSSSLKKYSILQLDRQNWSPCGESSKSPAEIVEFRIHTLESGA